MEGEGNLAELHSVKTLSLRDLGIDEETKYRPERDYIDYRPDEKLTGMSKRAYDTVPDFYKPEIKQRLDTNMPDFVIKIKRRGTYTNEVQDLARWLEGYGNRVGKMLCMPESRYCMVLTYEKALGSELVKTHKVTRLTANEVNEIDRLAKNCQLIPSLYKSSDGGKLTKFRITWLD